MDEVKEASDYCDLPEEVEERDVDKDYPYDDDLYVDGYRP